MAAAASSNVIIFDCSTAARGGEAVGFATGLVVAGGLGIAAAFELGAAGCGAELDTAAWRSGWRPMTIPAATPSSARNVADKIPFAFTQNLSRNGTKNLRRSFASLGRSKLASFVSRIMGCIVSQFGSN